jgi:hypothetical protein
MRKILSMALIVFSVCGFVYVYATLIPPAPKLDNKNWDISSLKVIFSHIDSSKVYNFHSYIRKPPYLVRAPKDMVYIFEIPKEELNNLFDTTPQYEYSETYELIEEKMLPQEWLNDINKKLLYMRKKLKHENIPIIYPSGPIPFFRINHKNPEWSHGIIIIRDSMASQNKYLIVYAQAGNY